MGKESAGEREREGRGERRGEKGDGERGKVYKSTTYTLLVKSAYTYSLRWLDKNEGLVIAKNRLLVISG